MTLLCPPPRAWVPPSSCPDTQMPTPPASLPPHRALRAGLGQCLLTNEAQIQEQTTGDALAHTPQCWGPTVPTRRRPHHSHYLLRELGRGSWRQWVGRQPLLQEHLLLTGVTPHPQCGQVYCQVVLFGLGDEIQNVGQGSPGCTDVMGLLPLPSLQKGPAKTGARGSTGAHRPDRDTTGLQIR